MSQNPQTVDPRASNSRAKMFFNSFPLKLVPIFPGTSTDIKITYRHVIDFPSFSLYVTRLLDTLEYLHNNVGLF